MKDLKVAISAPINDNIYSLLVTYLCISEPGIKVVGVYSLKLWSFKRFFNEFKRLRLSLLSKIWIKFFSLSSAQDPVEESSELLKDKELEGFTLSSLCLEKNIPFRLFNDPNDQKTINFLNEANPDIILSIGSVILKEEFLGIPEEGVLNVHMGILPEYRGIGVTEWPILESSSLKDIKLGITLHLLERGVDSGPIIFSKSILINSGDTIEKIEAKFLPMMVETMLDGVRLARDKKLNQMKRTQDAEGKQYYFLHYRMKQKVSEKLNNLLNES